MDIIQLYKSLLESLGLQVDEEGMISMLLDEEAYPCSVSDKRLVLPTQERLRSGDWAGKVAFHPLSENVLRGESPVLKKFRLLVNHRLTEVISTLMIELMEIAANSDYHKKLSPKQSEFLSRVPNADAKTLKSLNKVLGAVSTTGDKRLVSVYLKRGGKWKGEKYSRVAVSSFPITEEFETPDPRIFGVKVDRKKDKITIEELFRWIIPNADDLEEYSYGSNSMTAPYFHALCHSYKRIAHRLNAVTRQFKKHLDNPNALFIDTNWEDAIDNISEYRDLIPTLDGNDGTVIGEEKKGTGIQATPPPAPAPFGRQTPAPTPQVPVVTTAPPKQEPPRTGRGLDFGAIVERQQHQPVQGSPGCMPPQGIQPPWGAPAPSPAAPPPGEYAGRSRGVPLYQQPTFNPFGGGAPAGLPNPHGYNPTPYGHGGGV